MTYTALIGNPVHHSVSPYLYETLIKNSKPAIEYRHLKIKVTESDLKKTLTALQTLGFVGMNVTLPYKLEVIPYLDTIDEVASTLGAVNTVRFDQGKCIGTNTDWYGFFKPLQQKLTERSLDQVTIFGNGGAARAAIYASFRLGFKKISVLHRNEEGDYKLDTLRKDAKKLGIELTPYEKMESTVTNSSLIINATSTGMIGNAPYPFDISQLEGINLEGKIYFDAVFNPVSTPLLSYFKNRGSETIDGLWMMIYQGVQAMEFWLGDPLSYTSSTLNDIHEMLAKKVGENV